MIIVVIIAFIPYLSAVQGCETAFGRSATTGVCLESLAVPEEAPEPLRHWPSSLLQKSIFLGLDPIYGRWITYIDGTIYTYPYHKWKYQSKILKNWWFTRWTWSFVASGAPTDGQSLVPNGLTSHRAKFVGPCDKASHLPWFDGSDVQNATLSCCTFISCTEHILGVDFDWSVYYFWFRDLWDLLHNDT